VIARLHERIQQSDRYPRTLLLTCLMGMYATTFTATILTVSIKRVATDLDSTPQIVAWVVTAPLLAQAVAMPILGRLGDIRGHRRVYLTGFSISMVFSILTALSQNAGMLIGFRTIAQLAGTSTVPASYAMLFLAFPPTERVRASAWASGTLSGASVSGLAVGGVIVDSVGWRPLFVIQAVLSLAALVPAVLVLKRTEPREHVSLDRPGAVALAVASFSLAFGINRAAVWGLHPVVLALAVVFPIALWALVRIERRAPHPLLPVELLSRRNVRVAGASAFLMGGSHSGSFLITPLLLQSVFRYSATTTSLITVSRTLSISLSAPSSSRLGVRFGERRMLMAGGCAMAVGGGLMATGSVLELIPVVVVAMMVAGVAFGHAQPSLVSLAGNAVDEDDFGLAASLQQFANQIGSVLVMSLLSALVGDATGHGPFAAAYLIIGTIAGLGAVIAAKAQPLEHHRHVVEPGADSPDVEAAAEMGEVRAEDEVLHGRSA
jgi:MFS family permease